MAVQDYEDWLQPVAIAKSIIIEVKITGSTISIPITIAESMITLDVNITNTSINVNVTNASFDVNVTNSLLTVQVSGTANVNVTNATLDVNITNSAINVPITIAESTVTLNVNITNTSIDVNVTNASFDVNVTNSVLTVSVSGTANVNVTNSTINVVNTDLNFDVDGNLNVNLNASAITLDVNITNSTLNVNVTNSTLDVVITNSTVNVPIKIVDSTVTLNVNVTGTASVSIDNATVYLNVKNESYEESRPVYNFVGTTGTEELPTAYWCVFIPHGARGFLNWIEFYVKSTDGNEASLTFELAIHPGGAPIYGPYTISTTSTTPELARVLIRKWWNYDSLFIRYVSRSGNNIRIFYDTEQPYNCWRDDGTNIYARAYRVWVKIGYEGRTVGDVPVSGTVNTINIPNITSRLTSGSIAIPDEGTQTVVTVKGMGKLLNLSIATSSTSTLWILKIYVDGSLAYWRDVDNLPQNVYPEVLHVKSTTSYLYFYVPIEFKRSLEVQIYNYSGATITFTADLVVSKAT